jgi:geranylgeranyl diphosphate synthase type I
VWGVDQAINAGLALSCYARLALHGMLERGVSPGTFLEIQRLLERTVIDLCRGQYLDIHYQSELPTLEQYLEMVRLKTGVLLGAACETGALVAGAREMRTPARKFGEALGIGFQLRDDYLVLLRYVPLAALDPALAPRYEAALAPLHRLGWEEATTT